LNNIEHLIRLANRIGAFFESMPDHAQAIEGIADHLHKFWPPRMRVAMLDFLTDQPDGRLGEAALSPIVLQALTDNRERLAPRKSPGTAQA
jgi:formate dehydrogenase subunit delta